MSRTLARRLALYAAETGGRYEPHHEPTLWLRGRVADLSARSRSGRLRPCPHLRPGMTGVVALWAPDRAVCPACLPELTLTGDEDRRCDRCAEVVDLVHPSAVAAAANLLVVLGLCDGCERREAA